MMPGIIGRWTLESFVLHEPSGDTFPLGPDAVGRLSYSSDGYVHVLIMSANRPQVGWQGLAMGTAADIEEAYNTVIGYCGPYEVQGDTVIHHIEVAVIARQPGTDVVRKFRLEGGKLYLEYRNPAGVDGSLVWAPVA